MRWCSRTKIQQEIAQKKALVFESIHQQLDAQDAVEHMDIYITLLTPQIEETIRAKYNTPTDNSASTTAIQSYYFPHGGVMTYTSTLGASVACTFLNYDDSYYYVLSQSTCAAQPIIEAILGAMPKWIGPSFTIFFTIRSVISAIQRQDILEADGYAYIMTVSDAVTTSTVVLGWHAYPYARVDSSCYNLAYEAFPSHPNPFEID